MPLRLSWYTGKNYGWNKGAIMRVLLTIFTLLVCTFSWGNASFMQRCHPISIKNDVALLKVKKPALIVLHNTSEHTVWLTHPIKNPGASAGWTSELSANHWSALFLTPEKESFKLACIKSIPGHEQRVACVEVLRLCTLSTQSVPKNANTAFWALENINKNDLNPKLVQRGFDWPQDEINERE